MNHLDLFSGIGGFALAASWVWGKDHKIVSFCETNKYCTKILNKHWPQTPVFPDIKRFSHESIKFVQIDLLTGGFPCQPASHVGNRKGTEDDRWLWPEMLRLVREIKPKWIIAENVRGLCSLEQGMVFKSVLSDLEDIGYEVQPFIIPAASIGAFHKRERLWIVAHSNSEGLCRGKATKDSPKSRQKRFEQPERLLECCSRVAISAGKFGRKSDGVSRRVDRLRALGNAIVPQCVMPIMEAIKSVDLVS